MKRLLIIDDEPYIVNCIYELFLQNQQLELDIYKAYSGVEALELLNRAKIDIVLSDIKMPDMDGIELLKEIHSMWPFCKVIFLTAYDRFDYIHEANKDGITYILKTEGDDVIINAVAKAAQEIDEQLKQEELILSARKQMELSRPILQKEFFMELLEGKNTWEIVQEQLNELRIGLDAKNDLFLLLGRSDEWFASMQATEKAKQSAVIQAIIEKYFSSAYKYYFLQLDSAILVWLIQPVSEGVISSNTWNKTIVYIKGAIESIQNQYKKSTKSTISFVTDSKPVSWDKVGERFAHLHKMMIYSGVNNNEMVLTKFHAKYNEADHKNYIKNVSFWMDKIHFLETYLESGQRKDFFEVFLDVERNLVPLIMDHPIIKIEVYFSLSLLFLNYISKYDSLMDEITLYPEIIKLTNINGSMKCEETFKSFENIADMIFVYQKNEKERNQNIVIVNLNDYIKNNLNKDLSLVNLAEYVYLNPIYLSRLYKQVTGINLSSYINNARISKAKKLLKESNLKVNDISSSVGYGSVAYFIRTFRENTGKTPQEYRES